MKEENKFTCRTCANRYKVTLGVGKASSLYHCEYCKHGQFETSCLNYTSPTNEHPRFTNFKSIDALAFAFVYEDTQYDVATGEPSEVYKFRNRVFTTREEAIAAAKEWLCETIKVVVI